MDYTIAGEAETLYLGFEITEDIPFGARVYHAGFYATKDELEIVMAALETSFSDYIISKLTSENI